MNTTPFIESLRQEIRKYIRSCKRDGITGMGLENLRQCVRTTSLSSLGAPRGTNAQFYYAQLFKEICDTTPDIKAFLI